MTNKTYDKHTLFARSPTWAGYRWKANSFKGGFNTSCEPLWFLHTADGKRLAQRYILPYPQYVNGNTKRP